MEAGITGVQTLAPASLHASLLSFLTLALPLPSADLGVGPAGREHGVTWNGLSCSLGGVAIEQLRCRREYSLWPLVSLVRHEGELMAGRHDKQCRVGSA